MAETTEQLIASVRQLREEYERALLVNRRLLAQRCELASQFRQAARRASEASPFWPAQTAGHWRSVAAPHE